MLRLVFVFFFISSFAVSNAQNVGYTKAMIDTLCGPNYDGRGYVFNGDVKAAAFIENECKAKGLKPIASSFTQDFSFGVNTFPGEMKVSLDGQDLKAGVDFQIQPSSIGIRGAYDAMYFKTKWLNSQSKLDKRVAKNKFENRIVILSPQNENESYQNFLKKLDLNPLNAEGYLIETNQKFTWSVGRRLLSTSIIQVSSESLAQKINTVQLNIDQQWINDYSTKNVIAQIKGESDSIVVFSAHYDHLGRMGKDTYIAGASDNASGTAMLLDLADYYLANPPKYTTVFIWFAGEEAGLVGSKYFVENPTFPLSKIKFLINLDLMADAKKGITVVNGTIFSKQFESLKALNEGEDRLDQVKARGAAANSDHYPFYEKGVPCFFIYTEGDYKHYHDINDVAENIPMTNYDKVFRLITAFVKSGC